MIHDIKTIMPNYCEETCWVNVYGEYDIKPAYLVIWICVTSDGVKNALIANSPLMTKIKEIVVKNNYPENARDFIHIGFESQETVDRESKGDWFLHFK